MKHHSFIPATIAYRQLLHLNAGIGSGKTRADHSSLADQLYACYARGSEVRRLVSILGESGLPPEGQRSLAFAASFEKGRLSQGSARRTLEETMELGWRFLAPFRATELKRVTAQQLAAHHGSQLGPSDQGGVETDVARPDR